MAGLLVGLLTSPVKAEALPLSRWQVPEETGAVQYQVSLFPFAVGLEEQTAISQEDQGFEQEFEVRFRLLELWEQIRDAIDP